MDASDVGRIAMDTAFTGASIFIPPLAPLAALIEPLLSGWLFGEASPQNAKVQDAAHQVIASVAGTMDPAAAKLALEEPARRDAARTQLQVILAAAQAEQNRSEEARRAQDIAVLAAQLTDVQSARTRDMAFLTSGKTNWRADAILLVAAVGLVSCVITISIGNTNAGAAQFIGAIGAGLLGVIITAGNFEFGSSRSSLEKSQQIGSMMNLVATQTVPISAPSPANAQVAPPFLQNPGVSR